MNTNLLTNLQATTVEADVPDSPDILRQVFLGIIDGQARTLNLGSSGLYFKRANVITAFIPADELLKLDSAPRPSPLAPQP